MGKSASTLSIWPCPASLLFYLPWPSPVGCPLSLSGWIGDCSVQRLCKKLLPKSSAKPRVQNEDPASETPGASPARFPGTRPKQVPFPSPLPSPMIISSHLTPPQDAVLLTPALCMGSHQPPTLTESKNIKPGPICRPTDERRCALDFRGDWQPVKAVRRGTCYPIPPTSSAPPSLRILAAKTNPSSGRGWLLPAPGAGPTECLTHQLGGRDCTPHPPLP